jgi:hypothetical protein
VRKLCTRTVTPSVGKRPLCSVPQDTDAVTSVACAALHLWLRRRVRPVGPAPFAAGAPARSGKQQVGAWWRAGNGGEESNERDINP